jgi:hypothetical protein
MTRGCQYGSLSLFHMLPGVAAGAASDGGHISIVVPAQDQVCYALMNVPGDMRRGRDAHVRTEPEVHL